MVTCTFENQVLNSSSPKLSEAVTKAIQLGQCYVVVDPQLIAEIRLKSMISSQQL